VAWKPLGWKAVGFCEIEPFPAAVLRHHYPEVLNFGDMTQLVDLLGMGLIELPDLLCGGTPCQAFSVAGLRRSLEDERGNLSLVFCEIANAIDKHRAAAGLVPGIVFWENVPGVLNTKDNAFGCFLAGLAGEDGELQPPRGRWENAGCVYGPERAVAWRILDAQYFGVAQRRRRVFVVASARDGFDPAAVLFEFDGLRRDSAPSREAGQRVANALTDRADRGGTNSEGQRLITQPYAVANCLTARMHKGINSTLDEGQTPVVTHSLRGEGFDASEDGTGRGTPLGPVQPYTLALRGREGLPQLEYRQDGTANALLTPNGGRGGIGVGAIAFHPTQDPISSADGTTHANGGGQMAVAFTTEQTPKFNHDQALTLTKQSPTGGGQVQSVMTAMQVRRLTPVECERLQGFPDNYTAIPWRKKPASECPDGPRYKALGNSWAVPVVRWIGARIEMHLAGLL
jgi:DNA (cytosine-5)-methyltransferase 1